MKRVFIIRHAKSSWKDMDLDDFDRPLNKRGKSNAPMMAERLKQRGIKPDVILSSPAKRAKKTAKIFAKELVFDSKVKFLDAMYDSDIFTLHNILKSLDDEGDTAFIFGHNPELNGLANFYVGFEDNIPTSGVVEVVFDVKSWSDISKKSAVFVSFDYPKKEY